jgi:tetratricopeptide (TPR) repeat protein
MKQQRGGSGLFEPFFAWYAPYFGAYSFVLARAQEYEADRCAVELSGRETAARALINLEIKARYLNEAFWPELLRQADLHPEPPAEPFSAMLDALRQPLAPNKAQLWFSQSLTRRHDYDDTHPALADRLRAMGYSRVGENAEINLFGIDNAQDSGENSFLKSPPDEFMTSRNRLWKERVAQGWRERHQFVGEAEKALAALDEKAKSEQLTVDEQWERARFLAGTKGYEAALPLLQGVLEVQSDHVGANYLLGEALLERGDEAGITHIELAMGKDISAVPEGCHLIYSFLKTHERLEEAEGYRKRVESHYDQIKRGQEERKGINVADQFLPHELPAERIEAIREQLSNIAPLRQAFLVRKVVRYFPEEPRYILGVAGKYPFYTYRSKRADRALIRLVASEVTFPGSTLIVALDQTARVLRKAIVRVDAEIYHS